MHLLSIEVIWLYKQKEEWMCGDSKLSLSQVYVEFDERNFFVKRRDLG